MRDDELLAAMWRAFQAAEHVGHPDGPMAAILAVVRAHDRDGERWRERAAINAQHEAELAALRAERDALRAEVELWKERAYQLRFAMSEWQPIETAPRNGSYFLAWRAHAVMPQIVRWDITYDAAEDTFGDHVYHLTHWMPLPESPK